MSSRSVLFFLFAAFFSNFVHVYAQTITPTDTPIPTTAAESSIPPTAAPTPSATSSGTAVSGNGTIPITSATIGLNASDAPDVYLTVPTLSVGRIELDVDNLAADINLNAAVAGLVTINAGVAVSIQKVNLTITNVDADLELVVRLGNLVQIVERVFNSLDLNPLLITALQDVGTLVDSVVGVVDGLLGSITQGGTTLSFIVDNLGNIVQDVTGGVSTIVGNYLTNMTDTGNTTTLAGGFTQKTYSYAPLGSLVQIIFNTLGQVVQATVLKGATTATSTASSVISSATAALRR